MAPEIIEIIKANPELVTRIRQIYEDVSRPYIDKYVDSLETKAGINRSQKAAANAIKPSHSAQSSGNRQGNHRDHIREAARQAYESLASAE